MKNKADLDVRHNLAYDLPAGIIVFLVAVPLCLGIALASGAPLFSGIISGIVGGIVVGIFSGSQLGVSGPAAGLAVIVLSAISELGAFDIFLLAVAISGLIQFLLGVLQAGIIGYYFPNAVIKAMLAGIGLIIIQTQLEHALGWGGFNLFDIEGGNIFNEIAVMFQSISPGAAFISAISLALLILWERPFMKRIKLFRIIQGPLVVVLLGIVLQIMFKGSNWALSSEQIVAIPVPENIGAFFGQFSLPNFSHWNNPDVWVVALTLAAISSIETLLCMEATDKLDPFKRVTPANQELKAQGIGNLVSGLIGGLPVVQVIVRGTTNIQSGGRTKMASIFHGVLLLVCAMSIPKILNLIPLSSLAAILLMVGYKLTKPILYKNMYKLGSSTFIPFMVTIIAILITNLLTGIGIGLVVAIFYVLYNNYRRPFNFEMGSQKDGIIRIELSEDVSFLNKANIQRALNKIPNNSHVIIDGSRCKSMDQDVVEIIEDFAIHCKYSHIRLDYIQPKIKTQQMETPWKALEHAIKSLPKALHIND
ncbi:SulP family inorganic anion transporter [Bacteroidia bacterium]|nr:SulP family inorganic anion transporter [Bacteroidia bacterium]